MWVSVTATIRMPFAFARSRYGAMSRRASTTTASPLALAADEIARLGQVFVVDALDQHVVSFGIALNTPGGIHLPAPTIIPMGVSGKV